MPIRTPNYLQDKKVIPALPLIPPHSPAHPLPSPVPAALKPQSCSPHSKPSHGISPRPRTPLFLFCTCRVHTHPLESSSSLDSSDQPSRHPHKGMPSFLRDQALPLRPDARNTAVQGAMSPHLATDAEIGDRGGVWNANPPWPRSGPRPVARDANPT